MQFSLVRSSRGEGDTSSRVPAVVLPTHYLMIMWRNVRRKLESTRIIKDNFVRVLQQLHPLFTIPGRSNSCTWSMLNTTGVHDEGSLQIEVHSMCLS
ncbi:hypothetical protein PISMIDRAFT_508886 [Pisolithus microcarpus 441]|uniref:Uncharacterized protein n=1 Tax=Pisolithus microcarpus 441 TaxID=765257 RepID=A0A0C9YB83_9AGAM|nr:hypothetical protein PISMIDRAFT_508886 [Pisolithus microcarpus 441]